MSKTAFALCMFALIAVVNAALPSFNSLMQGGWDVTVAKLVEAELSFNNVQIQSHLVKDNTTSSILGKALFNDTQSGLAEKEESLRFDFASQSENQGTAYTVTDSKLVPIFDFSFFNSTNDLMISSGDWLLEEGSKYSFVVTDKDRFMLSVTEATGVPTMYFGKRIPVPEQKTFWQTYSTWILMGAMVLVNTFMQKKARGMQEIPEAAAAPVAAPIASAAGQKKKKN